MEETRKTADFELWNTKEVSARLGIQEQTLALWRTQATGPKYLKIGRCVRYRPGDVLSWLEEQEVAR